MLLKTFKTILIILIILNIICFLVELIGFNSITISFIGLLILIFSSMLLFLKQKYTQTIKINSNFEKKKNIKVTKSEFTNKKDNTFSIIEIILVSLIILISILIFYPI